MQRDRISPRGPNDDQGPATDQSCRWKFDRLMREIPDRAEIEVLLPQSPCMAKALAARSRVIFPALAEGGRLGDDLVGDIRDLLRAAGRKPNFCPVTGISPCFYERCLYGRYEGVNKRGQGSEWITSTSSGRPRRAAKTRSSPLLPWKSCGSLGIICAISPSPCSADSTPLRFTCPAWDSGVAARLLRLRPLRAGRGTAPLCPCGPGWHGSRPRDGLVLVEHQGLVEELHGGVEFAHLAWIVAAAISVPHRRLRGPTVLRHAWTTADLDRILAKRIVRRLA